MDLPLKYGSKPFLSRLWVWAALLSIALTLGMGTTTAQANASIFAHIACGDTQLPDGGWVCNCEPGDKDCVAGKTHGDGGDDQSDLLEMNHHHHSGETLSGTLASVTHCEAPRLSFVSSFRPEPAARLSGIDPSQADQPPKI